MKFDKKLTPASDIPHKDEFGYYPSWSLVNFVEDETGRKGLCHIDEWNAYLAYQKLLSYDIPNELINELISNLESIHNREEGERNAGEDL